MAASERSWRRALELDPDDGGGFDAKRMHYTALGVADQAISAARREVELAPDQPAG